MAKTEISQEVKFESGQELSRFIHVNESELALLMYQSGKPFIRIYGDTEKEIKIYDPQKINELNFYTSLFNYKAGFGLADKFGTIILFESLNSKPITLKLKHPHPYAHTPPLPFLTDIVYHEITDSLVVSIEEAISTFFPAKYWTQIKLKKKKILGFEASMSRQILQDLKSLDVDHYPATSINFSETEWLSIQTIGVDKNRILLHTNGGSATRSKSGPDYEFSIISEFDIGGKFIINHKIENGKVFFTNSSSHFVVLPPNRKKLFVYSKDNFQLDFDISLTTNQYLGNSKARELFYVDMYKDLLYIGGKGFLNVCRLKF